MPTAEDQVPVATLQGLSAKLRRYSERRDYSERTRGQMRDIAGRLDAFSVSGHADPDGLTLSDVVELANTLIDTNKFIDRQEAEVKKELREFRRLPRKPFLSRYTNFRMRLNGVYLLIVGAIFLRASYLSEPDRVLPAVLGVLAIVGGIAFFVLKPLQPEDLENIFGSKSARGRKDARDKRK